MTSKVFKIESCHKCPFANNDNEKGYDYCNLSDFMNRTIKLDWKNWEQLPKGKRHKDCPLNDHELKFT